MRLIDADVLIERIQEEKEDNDAHCRLCMDATVDIIDAQLTVEAKPVGWIPCSEKLPEDETLLYWTTHEDGSLILHGYTKNNGFIYNWEVDDLEKRKRQGEVIAWMLIPEPEPYRKDVE